jgi:tartrate-resistant acid phosphatase type 5
MATFNCLCVVVSGLLAIASAADPISIDGNDLNFLMIGDWGGKPSSPYYTTAEVTLAATMGKKANEINSQFTIAMGDNFYDQGVANVTDMRFQHTFEVVP